MPLGNVDSEFRCRGKSVKFRRGSWDKSVGRAGFLPLVREREEKEAAGSAKGVLDRKKRKEGGGSGGWGRKRGRKDERR